MDVVENRKKKAEKVMRIYNWTRIILLVVLVALMVFGLSRA